MPIPRLLADDLRSLLDGRAAGARAARPDPGAANRRGIRNPRAGELRPHLLAHGSLALRVTKSALRITVLEGKSLELGHFAARSGSPSQPRSTAATGVVGGVRMLTIDPLSTGCHASPTGIQ
ncbi:MAG: hypothetical protein JWN61_2292 [Pseudonocardiales bacterium]|nr:hypothetical protein [Pseudonocardiales bacterium]